MKKQIVFVLFLSFCVTNTYAQIINSIQKVTILNEKISNDFKAKNDSLKSVAISKIVKEQNEEEAIFQARYAKQKAEIETQYTIENYAKKYLKKKFSTSDYFQGAYEYDNKNQVFKMTCDSIKPILAKIPKAKISIFMGDVQSITFSNLTIAILDYANYEFISGKISSEESNKSYQINNTLYFEKSKNKPTFVDEPPIYAGCIGEDNKQLQKCFVQKIQNHIAKNFNINLAQSLGLPAGKCIRYKRGHCIKREGKRYTVRASFLVNELGEIVNMKAEGPHQRVEEEAIRVLKLIPKMTPAKLHGKPVKVPFAIPIRFIVKE